VSGRLAAQLAFLNEADRLKSVLRATTLADGSRRENSGEHSWHIALYAMVLADQAGPGVNIDRVLRMLILHDLVEIDVGDVPIHSANGAAHGSAETAAADTVQFTRLIKEAVPYEERVGVIEALWKVAGAKEVNADERAFLRLVANLIGVTDQDSGLARQRVLGTD